MNYSAKTIRIVFFAAIAVLLSIAVVLYLNINNLIAAYNSVYHTREVETKVQSTFSGLKHAESSVRAFIISGEPVYLEEQLEFEQGYPQMIQELTALVSDNDKQTYYVQQFDYMIRERIGQLNRTVKIFREGTTSQILREQLTVGRQIMDRLQLLTKRMYEEEAQLLQKREQTKNRYIKGIPVYLVLLTFVLLVLLTLIFDHLQRQLKTLRATQAKLQQSNEQLGAQKKALELSNEELESFNYIASHDLKEPLRKIRTFASIIYAEDYDKFSEKGQYNFNRMQASAQRMQELLDDLLAYTRLKTAEESLEEVSLTDTVTQVTENMQELITESSTNIETSNLPVVQGIPFQLYQLFENLLHNAIKYRRNEVVNTITISASTIDASNMPVFPKPAHPVFHCIKIADNGLGFPQEYAHKAFDLFTRLHNNKEQQGTGIGLTICKKVVENHDGFIQVESQPGAGTTFFVYLPA